MQARPTLNALWVDIESRLGRHQIDIDWHETSTISKLNRSWISTTSILNGHDVATESRQDDTKSTSLIVRDIIYTEGTTIPQKGHIESRLNRHWSTPRGHWIDNEASLNQGWLHTKPTLTNSQLSSWQRSVPIQDWSGNPNMEFP